MKKYLLVLVSLCCALLPALAEHPEYPKLKKSDANIIGHVLDKKTSEHLPYITIALKGTTIGTVTDATGHYFLKNLPEGNFMMEVSSVGYKTVTRSVTLKKGKTLEENFELEEDAIALDGVVVSANRSETTRRLAPTASPDQWAGRPLYTDTHRLPSRVQCPFRGIRAGADSCQHDRTCRSHARGWIGIVRLFGHCGNDQYHYEGASAKFRSVIAYDHFHWWQFRIR